MSLIIEQYYHAYNRAPGKIIITIPNYGGTPIELPGFLISEPTFEGSNKWGTILGDVTSNLNDLQSLWGANNMMNWIGASVQCWKGTEPLKFSVDFYVVNYAPYLAIEDKIKALFNLTALAEGDFLESVTVQVHGGYKPKVLSDNTEQGFNGIVEEAGLKDGQAVSKVVSGSPPEGTVEVQIGERINFKGLLVSSVNITPSTVEVCSLNGSNIKPLYYRINAKFTGSRTLLKSDVDNFIS